MRQLQASVPRGPTGFLPIAELYDVGPRARGCPRRLRVRLARSRTGAPLRTRPHHQTSWDAVGKLVPNSHCTSRNAAERRFRPVALQWDPEKVRPAAGGQCRSDVGATGRGSFVDDLSYAAQRRVATAGAVVPVTVDIWRLDPADVERLWVRWSETLTPPDVNERRTALPEVVNRVVKTVIVQRTGSAVQELEAKGPSLLAA